MLHVPDAEKALLPPAHVMETAETDAPPVPVFVRVRYATDDVVAQVKVEVAPPPTKSAARSAVPVTATCAEFWP